MRGMERERERERETEMSGKKKESALFPGDNRSAQQY